MNKPLCYYAHTMLSYDSTIEQQDIQLLERLGFKVVNPNSKKIKEGLKVFLDRNTKDKTMDYFKEIVSECDLVAFRALPNGDILSGISAELQMALECNIPIIELPCSLNKRMQEYPETKQYLNEIGFYKVK